MINKRTGTSCLQFAQRHQAVTQSVRYWLCAAHQLARASQRDRSTSTKAAAALAEICRRRPRRRTMGRLTDGRIDSASAARMRRWRQLWRRRLFRDVTEYWRRPRQWRALYNSDLIEDRRDVRWCSARTTTAELQTDDELLQDRRRATSGQLAAALAATAGLRCSTTVSHSTPSLTLVVFWWEAITIWSQIYRSKLIQRLGVIRQYYQTPVLVDGKAVNTFKWYVTTALYTVNADSNRLPEKWVESVDRIFVPRRLKS